MLLGEGRSTSLTHPGSRSHFHVMLSKIEVFHGKKMIYVLSVVGGKCLGIQDCCICTKQGELLGEPRCWLVQAHDGRARRSGYCTANCRFQSYLGKNPMLVCSEVPVM